MLNPDRFTIDDYIGKTFLCDCRKNHRVDIKNIILSETALSQLPEMILSAERKKAFLLFDATTYPILGKRVENLFISRDLSYHLYMLHEKEPIPDERTLGEVLVHFDKSCDIIVAVGSGTINDICRYFSSQLNLPYIIVATAPSMDGFASNVSALIINHMKTTYEAHMPLGIIADTSILKEAPMDMITAGVGDILGKYTSLCDWELARIILGEYHCPAIVKMVRKAISTIMVQLDHISDKDYLSIQGIMEGLITSGIAMSYAGNSRPASGSEHHLSHYWEMTRLFEEKPPLLHGTMVGIGTIAILKAYELLLEHNISFDKAKDRVMTYSQSRWEEHIHTIYHGASASVIQLELETGKNQPAHVFLRLETLEEKWDQIKELIQKLPTADSIYDILTSLSAKANPIAIGIEKETFLHSFLYAKELRNRYGLLQMLFDLGLSTEIAQKVWNYFELRMLV